MSNRALDRSKAIGRCAVWKTDMDIDARNPPRGDIAHRPRAANHRPSSRRAEPSARVVSDAGGERCDEQLDRGWPGVVAAIAAGLVHQQLVAPYLHAVTIAAGPDDGQLVRSFR
jgi:hypothetical protein